LPEKRRFVKASMRCGYFARCVAAILGLMRCYSSGVVGFCHCERSEAIHHRHESGLLRRYAPRNDVKNLSIARLLRLSA
jgi:hypothetical protein